MFGTYRVTQSDSLRLEPWIFEKKMLHGVITAATVTGPTVDETERR
jgi:hypothetical protein